MGKVELHLVKPNGIHLCPVRGGDHSRGVSGHNGGSRTGGVVGLAGDVARRVVRQDGNAGAGGLRDLVLDVVEGREGGQDHLVVALLGCAEGRAGVEGLHGRLGAVGDGGLGGRTVGGGETA